MGPENAYNSGEKLLRSGVKCLVSWGTAAGLSKEVKAGDLILPEKVIGSDGEYYQTDNKLRNHLIDSLSSFKKVHSQNLYATENIIIHPDTKLELGKETQSAACDMESSSLGKLAKKHDIPFLVVRAVTDTYDMKFPRTVIVSMTSKGEINIAKFIFYALSHPGEWASIYRIYRGYGKASNSLKLVAAELS